MNTKHILVATFSTIVLACSSAPVKQTTNKANPCLTKGATYLQESTELRGGTCGEAPITIINVNPDGTVNGSVSCDSVTQNGCTARDTGCVVTYKGCDAHMDFQMEVSTDGSTGHGIETMTVDCGNVTCTSTYSVTLTRQ